MCDRARSVVLLLCRDNLEGSIDLIHQNSSPITLLLCIFLIIISKSEIQILVKTWIDFFVSG